MTPQEQITELKQLLHSMDLRLTQLEIQQKPTVQTWLSPSQIMEVVCRNYDVTEASLRRRYPTERVKIARVVAIHLFSEYTTLKHAEIALHFGALSHSVVNQSNKVVESWRKKQTSKRADFDASPRPFKLELEIINNIYNLVK